MIKLNFLLLYQTCFQDVECEVLREMPEKIPLISDITPCSPIKLNCLFGEKVSMNKKPAGAGKKRTVLHLA
jgi:hypothetical protein